jgi:two-component system NarL family sensor kinase
MARMDPLPRVDEILQAREAERTRLAEHLHDRPIQRLSAVALALDRIPAVLLADEEAVAMDIAMRAAELVREEIASLRELMVELRRPISEPSDLQRWLEDEAARLCGLVGVDCEVEVELADPLPNATATTLLDVAREALANVVKHAGARSVSVLVIQSCGRVELRVLDDGIGFDEHVTARTAPPDHIGLAQMRRRVSDVGGSCRISSAPGVGTEVRAVLPIQVPA